MTVHRSPIGALAPITPEDMVADRTAEPLTYTRTQEFDRLAIEYGFITGDLVERLVTALLDIGIDYKGLRQAEITRATTDAHLTCKAAAGPTLLVGSAATPEAFTLCTTTGALIWHETFTGKAAPDATAATIAVEKAIELAGHSMRDWGAEAAVLRLNLACSRGVDLPRLHRIASATCLVLEIATISTDNPAEQHTADTLNWRTADLLDLWQPPETRS